jgi:hypothetical protein
MLAKLGKRASCRLIGCVSYSSSMVSHFQQLFFSVMDMKSVCSIWDRSLEWYASYGVTVREPTTLSYSSSSFFRAQARSSLRLIHSFASQSIDSPQLIRRPCSSSVIIPESCRRQPRAFSSAGIFSLASFSSFSEYS